MAGPTQSRGGGLGAPTKPRATSAVSGHKQSAVNRPGRSQFTKSARPANRYTANKESAARQNFSYGKPIYVAPHTSKSRHLCRRRGSSSECSSDRTLRLKRLLSAAIPLLRMATSPQAGADRSWRYLTSPQLRGLRLDWLAPDFDRTLSAAKSAIGGPLIIESYSVVMGYSVHPCLEKFYRVT